MKKILKLTFLLFLISVFSRLYAQSRVDASVIQLDSSSHNLPNVKRWMLMPSTGKWEGDGKTPEFLQWSVFNYKGQKYHVFVYQDISGHYTYPAIKEDYVTDYRTSFIVFTAKEFQDITDKLNQKKGKTYYFRSASNGYNVATENTNINNAIDDKLLKSLTDVMDGARILQTNLVFAMNSQVVDGAEVVRFDRPADPEAASYLLKKDYYEMPFADFMKAMKMK